MLSSLTPARKDALSTIPPGGDSPFSRAPAQRLSCVKKKKISSDRDLRRKKDRVLPCVFPSPTFKTRQEERKKASSFSCWNKLFLTPGCYFPSPLCFASFSTFEGGFGLWHRRLFPFFFFFPPPFHKGGRKGGPLDASRRAARKPIRLPIIIQQSRPVPPPPSSLPFCIRARPTSRCFLLPSRQPLAASSEAFYRHRDIDFEIGLKTRKAEEANKPCVARGGRAANAF